MIRELDQRNSSGDIVTLYWNPVTDIVFLTVHRDLGDGVELVTASVPEIAHANAADAFKHPYFYAGHSGSITLPARTSTYADFEPTVETCDCGDHAEDMPCDCDGDEREYGDTLTTDDESEV